MTNPKHTDTSRSGDLVANMRETIREWERDEPRDDWWLHQHDHAAAADLIETQAREIERLRVALGEIMERGGAFGGIWCALAAQEALAGVSHDQ